VIFLVLVSLLVMTLQVVLVEAAEEAGALIEEQLGAYAVKAVAYFVGLVGIERGVVED
jgi:hypothetical protein